MEDMKGVTGTPLVLLINDEEWTSRSLQSILKPNGYAVLLAYTGQQGIDLASKVTPDMILVDLKLPDFSGEELSRRLRTMPNVRPSTPIILFTAGSIDRRRRIECLRAGAWHILQPPFDPDELLMRLGTYVQAKQDVDKALTQTHLDPVTGFYNVEGLMRRAGEIAADAARNHRPVACVVLGPSTLDGASEEDGGEPDARARLTADCTKRLADLLVATTRVSDSIARVGETEFVILAPGTDPTGAARLAERLLEAADADGEIRELPLGLNALKAGIHAASESESEAIIPEELLRKATLALRRVQSEANGTRTMRFENERAPKG